jgi:hypothetical protein
MNGAQLSGTLCGSTSAWRRNCDEWGTPILYVGGETLDRGHGVDYGDALWRGEAEGPGRDGNVGLFAGEGEAGDDAVGFLDFNGGDDAVGCDGEG